MRPSSNGSKCCLSATTSDLNCIDHDPCPIIRKLLNSRNEGRTLLRAESLMMIQQDDGWREYFSNTAHFLFNGAWPKHRLNGPTQPGIQLPAAPCSRQAVPIVTQGWRPGWKRWAAKIRCIGPSGGTPCRKAAAMAYAEWLAPTVSAIFAPRSPSGIGFSTVLSISV
jgi:hypothetical protein